MTAPDDHQLQGLFPIRTVVAETGVNAITLRAWERRYGLIRPVRTPSGHRLYSQADIDLVRRIMQLQDKGIPVSRAIAWLKQHPGEPLPGEAPSSGTLSAQTLPAKTPPAKPLSAAAPAADEAANATTWAALRARMIDAVSRFDEFDLETIWNDAVEQFPVDVVLNFLLVPVGKVLADAQAAGPLDHNEICFYSPFLRNKLGARYASQSRVAQGPKVVLLAAAAGDDDEIPLLLTGIVLAQQGLRPLLFATGTPLAGLPAVIRRSRARALVLMGTAAATPARVDELTALVREGIPVFMGGELLATRAEQLRRLGITPLDADPATAARLVRDILGSD